MVSRALSLGLRGFQFLMAFLVMVLIANMIQSTGSGPAVTNFDLFASVFALLSLIYLIIATVNESFVVHPAIILALDVVNAIWMFIGGVATAAILGTRSCSSNDYLKSNKITRGSGKRCNESKASTVFLFLGFFAFLVSSIFTALSSRGRVNMRSNPSMSQVTV